MACLLKAGELMTAWIFIYALGIVLLWPGFAVGLVRSLPGGYDSEDYFFGAFFGLFIALVWPASLVVLGMTRLVRHMIESADRESY